MIKTKIDKIASLIKEKPMSLKDLSSQLDLNQEIIEIVGRNLETRGIMRLDYPAVGSPILSLVKVLEEKHESIPTSFDEKYSFDVNGVNVTIYIYRDQERRPFYHVVYSEPAPYTLEFLKSLEPEIARDIPLDTSYFLTPERMQAYLPTIYNKVKDKLSVYFGEHLDQLAGYTFINMYGMRELEILMGDENLEEISVNTSLIPISVYHRNYGWMKTNLKFKDEEEIANIASQIARRVGQQITIANPILDAFLTTGDRATATLFPASTKGNTITIRKFAKEPWTVTKFIANHTLSVDMAALLWQAVHYEMNVIATGGTASGKTSLLNIMMQLSPPYQRIVSIEETREIALPEHIWNWVPLLVREGGPSLEMEKVKISMADLLITSLRMRPDRIILGEVRSPDEAKVLFDAMHTGHSVSTTFHADSANQMLKRMLEPPFSIHATEVESIHLVVVQHRDRRRNLRRTFEISEISPGLDGSLSTNRLYIWRPRTDKFEEINKPRRYIEDINIYTGMTEKEIYDDLEERKRILNWMVRQKYFDILQISEVAKAYYNTPDVLYRAVEKDRELEGVPKPKHLFEAPTLSTFNAVSSEKINLKEESKSISLSKIPEVEFSTSEVLKTLTEEIEKAKAEKRSKKPKGKKR
ncbi:MAG: type II/IV secretion system ATPase subunit [Candidatus Micrarchaeia archaeon]